MTDRLGVPTPLIVALGLGTLLNPLNSSMIAVALVRLQHDFDIGVATSTWLVSAFYVAASVGQPLMGRLIDQFGARQLFLVGLVIVFATSLASPFAPDFWWLVGIRAAQAVGSSAAFPASVVLVRHSIPEGGNPAAGLGVLSVTASASAALGPVIGGLLVTSAGWQAIFWINLPLTVAGFVLGWRAVPHLATNGERSSARTTVARLDLPGVTSFTVAVTMLLLFLLSFAGQPRWWCLPVFLVAGGYFVVRERSAPVPFIDIRELTRNRPLSTVLTQQAVINLAFYCIFFGMPLWLEGVRGLDPGVVGMLLLPITAVSSLTTPLTALLIGRRGPRLALIIGGSVLVVNSLLLQLMTDGTPLWLFVVFAVLLGVPNGFNNLGLQTSLYQAAPPEQTGTASGLFQTCRYLGAILASTALGIVFEHDLTSTGLHHIGYLMTSAAVVVLALSLIRWGRGAATRS
ncbi:MAG: MFS transporter [Streptosporangiales bacterium]|nr:MFS transporter [Streptosporangiales bacterium]